MGVYEYPYGRRSRVAYTWFGSRVPTPRWFDDSDGRLLARHPRLGRVVLNVWAVLRSWGVIRLRLWDRPGAV